MIYDIAVVGAGPSGSTLARLLANDFNVLLIDKRSYDDCSFSREKCCGGLLAPDAQRMIAKLDLALPKDILSDPQLFSVRAIDFESNLECDYQRHYINMDRRLFDSWLVNLIPETVDRHFSSSLKKMEKKGNLFELTVKEGSSFRNFEARMVAGADGADSKVRKLLYGNKEIMRSYTAVQEWFHIDEMPKPTFFSLFNSGVTDFYSWVIFKENSLLLGSAINGGDVANRFDLLKKDVVNYGFDLTKPVRKNGTKLLRPGFLNGFFPGKKGVFLIGEAAGLISPSSAEGLSYAMESALILSDSIKKNPEICINDFKEKIKPIRRKLLLKGLKASVMYNKFIRKWIMKSGFLTIR